MDENKKRRRNNYLGGALWTFITFVLVAAIGIVIYPYLPKESPNSDVSMAATCSCIGPLKPVNCPNLTPFGEAACEKAELCLWYCPVEPLPALVTTCTALGVTEPWRQCKCADCDIPGSVLCVNDSGTLKECCTTNLSWAHGGCCDKYHVWCGCSDLTSLDDQVLLFCDYKDLSQYGNVTFKYKSTTGKCLTNPCID